MSAVGPTLRFSEFSEPWREVPFSQLLERASNPVDVKPGVEYREIGVRSHGRGLFHKEPVTNKELGNKRVFHVVPDALVLNIVFAWEQAVALTSEDERGFIASHRFPMFLEKDGQSYLPFVKQLLLTPRGKLLLEIASPGGAGRNKTLGQDAFLKLKPVVPNRDEQKKVATFFDSMSRKITLLTEKKTALEEYKRGVMQRLFSGALRFTQDDGTPFPEWEVFGAGDLFKSVSNKDHDGSLPVLSITQENGAVLRDDVGIDIKATAASVASYKIVEPGDYIISLRSFQGGIEYSSVKGICSPAYTIMKPNREIHDGFYKQFLKSGNFVRRLALTVVGIRDGKQISYRAFSPLKLPYPHPDEQRKIADFLSAIDAKIDAVSTQISEMESFKKGLLQKMFV